MEIKITSSDGVQDNSIISIRAAGTRRQAPIDTVKSKSLKFPDSLEKCCMEPVKIDIYAPVATARLVLQPTEGSYKLPLDHKDAITTNLGLVVSNSKENGDSQTVAAEAPGRPSSAARYQDAAASAREYLEEHGLLRYIQSLLHAVIQVKPKDPYGFMTQQMAAWVQSVDLPNDAAEQPEKTQSPNGWAAAPPPERHSAAATAPGALTTPAKPAEVAPATPVAQVAPPVQPTAPKAEALEPAATVPTKAAQPQGPPAAEPPLPPLAPLAKAAQQQEPRAAEPPLPPVAPPPKAPRPVPAQPKEPERAVPKPQAAPVVPAVPIQQAEAPKPLEQPPKPAVQDEDAGLSSLKHQLREHLKEAVDNGNLEKFLSTVTAGEEPQSRPELAPYHGAAPVPTPGTAPLPGAAPSPGSNGGFARSLSAQEQDLKQRMRNLLENAVESGELEKKLGSVREAEQDSQAVQPVHDRRITELKSRMRELLEQAAVNGTLAEAFESIQRTQGRTQQAGPTLLASKAATADAKALKVRVRERLETAAASGALKQALDAQFPLVAAAAPSPPSSPPRPEPSPPAAMPPSLPIKAPTASVSVTESQTATEGGTEADGGKELEADVRRLAESQEKVVEDNQQLKSEMQRLEEQIEQLREQHQELQQKSMQQSRQRPTSALATRSNATLQNAGSTMTVARPTSAGPRS